MDITPYKPEYAKAFKDLNIAWLNKFFVVEPIDELVLSNPEQYILTNGGYIYFAVLNNEPVGCFAFMKDKKTNEIELTKMAVSELHQGKNIGNELLIFALEEAKKMGFSKLILYSNTKLIPAIHLYKKYGFVEIELGGAVYKRANIKMEKKIQ